jgi:hypothetical protein
MLFGSIAGMVGGYHLASAAQLTPGEARTMAADGDLGLAFGFGAGFLLRFGGGPRVCPPEFSGSFCFPNPDADSRSRKMAASGLIGSSLGLVGGYLLARHRDNTWGDGEVLRAGTLLGVWSGIGLAEVAKTSLDPTNRPFTGALMAGGTLGLFVGDHLVRSTDFTPGQAILIDLSMVSGGLVGAGTTYLITKDGPNSPYFLGSSLGAMIGFGLSYWRLHDAPESATTRRLSGLAPSGVALVPTAGARGERGVALAGLF